MKDTIRNKLESVRDRFEEISGLLADPDVIARQRAMVHLLHLPARHARTHPFLAGLAMALVAEGLESSGDTARAEAMRREIATSFPAHPVGNWPVAGARSGLPTTKEFG